MPARIAVVGIHGFGSRWVDRVRSLDRSARAELAAVVDPAGPDDSGAPWFATLGEALAAVEIDVVIVATPIHTHLPLALQALEAGCDVLLEKPTVASLAEFERLVDAVERTGRRCQVGFQTFGSAAVGAVRDAIAAGEIGALVGIGATGEWTRDQAYWQRSRWAGRRTLDGVAVVDGVVTNPLAHAVATALRIGGAYRAADVASVELDQWRANDIEADDTSSVVVTDTGGRRYGFGLTLCADDGQPPARVLVFGERGRIELDYERDVVRVISAPGDIRETAYERVDLLEDLLAARASGAALRADVRETGAFMRVLEGVRTAPDPRRIPAELVSWEGSGSASHPVVRDVATWVRRVAAEQRTFTQLGAPWARAPRDPHAR